MPDASSIQHPASRAKAAPIGIGCDLVPQGGSGRFVVMLKPSFKDASSRKMKQDGEYFGPGNWAVSRNPTGDIIKARKIEEDETVIASGLGPWVPTIQLEVTPSDIYSGFVDTLYYFNEPGALRNPYGDGHVFWMVFILNGVEEIQSAHPTQLISPGGSGGDLYDIGGTGLPVTATVNIYYDSTLAMLVCTNTVETTS